MSENLKNSQTIDGSISDTERLRRERAVNHSLGFVGLEGFTPSKEAQDQARQFINGGITFPEFVEALPKET